MLVLQIALGVMLGMLGYHALTKTRFGYYALVAGVWLVALAIVAAAGGGLWLWKGDSLLSGAVEMAGMGALLVPIGFVAIGVLVAFGWWTTRWATWSSRDRVKACGSAGGILILGNMMYVAVQAPAERGEAALVSSLVSIGTLVLVYLTIRIHRATETKRLAAAQLARTSREEEED